MRILLAAPAHAAVIICKIFLTFYKATDHRTKNAGSMRDAGFIPFISCRNGHLSSSFHQTTWCLFLCCFFTLCTYCVVYVCFHLCILYRLDTKFPIPFLQNTRISEVGTKRNGIRSCISGHQVPNPIPAEHTHFRGGHEAERGSE